MQVKVKADWWRNKDKTKNNAFSIYTAFKMSASFIQPSQKNVIRQNPAFLENTKKDSL